MVFNQFKIEVQLFLSFPNIDGPNVFPQNQQALNETVLLSNQNIC